MRAMIHRPDLTVAAIVESNGRFLLVEEQVGGALMLNQPAGHVEPGESPLDAVIRETREETGWAFEPEALTGLYLWRSPESGRTILRLAFGGVCTSHDPECELDRGIVRPVWLTRAQLGEQRTPLRTPMVLRCIDDYLRGERYPLAALKHLETHRAAARLRS
jgi:8-oxo-dGTP pyrophosphatase MutT (NUDIX family)